MVCGVWCVCMFAEFASAVLCVQMSGVRARTVGRWANDKPANSPPARVSGPISGLGQWGHDGWTLPDLDTQPDSDKQTDRIIRLMRGETTELEQRDIRSKTDKTFTGNVTFDCVVVEVISLSVYMSTTYPPPPHHTTTITTLIDTNLWFYIGHSLDQIREPR